MQFWDMMMHQWLGGPSKYLSSETTPHSKDQNPCLSALITVTCASAQNKIVRTVQDTAWQQGRNNDIESTIWMFNYNYYFCYKNIVLVDINE
jgi:hypothetical protein